MEEKKSARRIGRGVFAGLFLAALGVFSAFNLLGSWEKLAQEAGTFQWQEAVKDLAELNEVLEEEVLWRYPMVEAYGAVQLALGKREENNLECVRDRDGYLYSGNLWNGFGDDPKELAMRVRRLFDTLEAQGTRTGFILYPIRTVREGKGYYGIPYEDLTGQGDDFLRWLRYYGVPYLDLREGVEESGLTYEDIYFKTDHHWTPRAAFEGFRLTVDWMNDTMRAELDPDGSFRDLNNYFGTVLPGLMLGSKGRDAGVLFAGGTEDYEVLVPKDQGDFTWTHGRDGREKEVSGPFGKVQVNLKTASDGLYTSRANRIYLEEIQSYDSLENHGLQEGPKVLLLRDSYASPMGAFLSQCCSRLDMLWTQDCEAGQIEAFLEENRYDYVLLTLYPKNLSEINFPFCPTEDVP